VLFRSSAPTARAARSCSSRAAIRGSSTCSRTCRTGCCAGGPEARPRWSHPPGASADATTARRDRITQASDRAPRTMKGCAPRSRPGTTAADVRAQPQPRPARRPGPGGPRPRHGRPPEKHQGNWRQRKSSIAHQFLLSPGIAPASNNLSPTPLLKERGFLCYPLPLQGRGSAKLGER